MRKYIGAFIRRYKITRIVIFIFSAAVSMAVFYLWQSGKLIEKTNATDSYAEIVQPYLGSQVIAHTDATEGSTYEWTVNAVSQQSGIVPTTFLTHFDGSLQTVSGEDPITNGSVTYEDTKFGQGMVGSAEYPISGNIDLTEGTLDLWLTLKKPLDDLVFDSSPYFFFYRNVNTYDTFMVNVHDTNGINFTMYDHSDGWSLSTQLSSAYYTLSVGVPFHYVATWSEADKLTKVYLNGEQISRRDYADDQHFPGIIAGLENMQIGNQNVVIDELRILNEALSTDQIKDNYVRGTSYSQSDIYYDNDVSEGDTVGISVTDGGIPLTDNAVVAPPKFTITGPDGYFVPYTDSLNITFTTPSAMLCHYGTVPDTYENLPLVAQGTGTSHTITYAVDSIIEQYPVAIKCQGANDNADDYGFFRRYRIIPIVDNNYPKIARVWGGSLPNAQEIMYLGKFTNVSLSGELIRTPNIAKSIKQVDPNIILTIYNAANGVGDYPSAVSSQALLDRMDPNMRLRNAGGEVCSDYDYPSAVLFNLYLGSGFTEVSAEFVQNDLIDRLGYIDGLWWDNSGLDFWSLNQHGVGYNQLCDFDMDGDNEDLNNPADYSYALSLFGEGLYDQISRVRSRIGNNAIEIGNAAPFTDMYNGRVWEESFKPSSFNDFFNANNTDSFLHWQANSLSPRLNSSIFNNKEYVIGSQDYYRYHRFGLAGSLLSGVHYDPKNSIVKDQVWFDEFWINLSTAQPTETRGIGRGYLGEPVSDYFQVTANVYRRDFENGIVLLNNQSGSVVIDVGGTYRYIDATNGGQDPTANPGGETSSVTLMGYDGRILLNLLPPVDDTPPGAINDLNAI